ncbi:hypothetical protein K2P97_07095 [bacterium]|nr:hypothetical protein [bacterium]
MLDKFFFSNIDNRHYALMRITFGFLMFLAWLELTPLSIYFNNNDTFVSLYLYSLILSSLLLLIGLFTRTSIIYLYIGFSYFAETNFNLIYIGDKILILILTYLFFSGSGDAWSVDRLLSKNKKDFSSVFVMRMIQIHVSIIYVLCGLSKFLYDSWLIGQAPFEAMALPLYNRWNLDFLAEYPLVLSALYFYSIVIVFWESLFPLFQLNRYSKYISLLIGCSLHFEIIVFMNHRLFGYIMLATYISLLSFDEIKKIFCWFKKLAMPGRI